MQPLELTNIKDIEQLKKKKKTPKLTLKKIFKYPKKLNQSRNKKYY
jgi:hypothetical protein